jgi:copper chaperone CopZ
MDPIRLSIESMASAGGIDAVENAIRMVPGVLSVRADSSGTCVLVEAADSVASDDLIAAALKAGYIATLAG